MNVVFGAVALLGAALLFMVQPLVARLLLPYYGGSPTVWTTSSLFFQVALLLGYLFAHVSTVRLGARRQPLVQGLVLLLPLATLPLALPAQPAPDEGTQPVWWLLRTLLLTVGVPFVVLSTSGPTIQRWLSWTSHRRAEDPYYLYALSNVGSFVGLLAYPFLIEPLFTLEQQRTIWSAGYVVFALLSLAAAVWVLRGRKHVAAGVPVGDGLQPPTREVSWSRRLRWLFLAFVPSSLMLGVTTYITTDLAAVPLLWVVPLAIYLATYVAAFSRRSRRPPAVAMWLAAGLAMVSLITLQVDSVPLLLLIVLHLTTLAFVGFAGHGALAADRPPPASLTQFFVVIAVGGALGGLLNGVIAPLLLNGPWEYPLVLALVPLIALWQGPSVKHGLDRLPSGWLRPVGALAALILVVGGLTPAVQGQVAVLGLVMAVVGSLGLTSMVISRPVGLAAVLTLGAVAGLALGPDRLFTGRTFFGSYQVLASQTEHRLMHGTTLHGLQVWDPEPSLEPTTYYSRNGPLGDLFRLRGASADRVGLVGLGVGTAATYGEPGQQFVFVEIDPVIQQIAEDQRLFTFLSGAEADIEVVIGDGRLVMAGQPDESLDLIVLDAFTSDAIPVHLLTQQALATYLSKLGRDGLLAVHISNRHLDLEPVLHGAASALGIAGVIRRSEAEDAGSTASVWVVLGRPEAVASFGDQAGWRSLRGPSVEWTDDYAPIVTVWLR